MQIWDFFHTQPTKFNATNCASHMIARSIVHFDCQNLTSWTSFDFWINACAGSIGDIAGGRRRSRSSSRLQTDIEKKNHYFRKKYYIFQIKNLFLFTNLKGTEEDRKVLWCLWARAASHVWLGCHSALQW